MRLRGNGGYSGVGEYRAGNAAIADRQAPVSPYVAGLPMYDWPEVCDEIDALWTAIAARLCDAGIEAPQSLSRPDRLEDLWTVPDLLLGQACGLDVVDGLRGRVEVLGSLDYGIGGCEPGDYRSVLICRADDDGDDLAAFRGGRVACNGRRSWSGHGALMSGPSFVSGPRTSAALDIRCTPCRFVNQELSGTSSSVFAFCASPRVASPRSAMM